LYEIIVGSVSVVLIVLDIIMFINLKRFINKHGDEPIELYWNAILGRAAGVISVIVCVLSMVMQIMRI